MRKRRENGDDDHFDLLPFIAILLCTLGCLLFVTLAVGAVNLGQSTDVWDPIGPIMNKRPILVEWDGNSAIVQLASGDVTIPIELAPDGSAISGVDRLLDMMAARRKTHEYALFAVRPSGFATFDSIHGMFLERKLDIGFQPEAQTKKVRLGRRHV